MGSVSELHWRDSLSSFIFQRKRNCPSWTACLVRSASPRTQAVRWASPAVGRPLAGPGRRAPQRRDPGPEAHEGDQNPPSASQGGPSLATWSSKRRHPMSAPAHFVPAAASRPKQ